MGQPTRTTQTISTTTTYDFPKLAEHNVMTIGMSGTYTGLTFTFQGSMDNGSTFCNIASISVDSMQITAGGTSISPSNSATRIWRIACEGMTHVRVNVSVLSSGTITAIAQSDTYQGGVFSQMLVQSATLTGNSAITGTQTITSSDSSALTVGANGATNPAIQVDASTASSATGVKVKSAAAAGGVALSVISSGTNENLTVDAKGSGTITFGGTSTGNIVFSRDALVTASGKGVGYGTGAGSTVTQGTNRTTGVTINAATGAITLVSAAGSATAATFTVTNSAVAATDVVIVNQKSGTDKYLISVTAVGAGSFAITSQTTGGTTTEQPVFNFAVIKGVAA